MKDYRIDQLRNVVLLSHGSAGKTSLVEAMLFDSGAIKRLGRVEEGTTVSDYDEEEIRRRISLNLSILPCEWKGHKLNIMDTPGYADFIGEVISAVWVADGVVLLLDAVSGVEVGTEQMWSKADERALPRLVVINKMDRENADFYRSLEALKSNFKANFIPVQLPLGSQADFEGVIDLVTLKAYRGDKAQEVEVPADLRDTVDEYRLQLAEAAAESDDALIEKYLEGEELTTEELQRGLRAATLAGDVVPVLCAAATANIGIQPLMDAIVAYLPSPADAPPVKATNPATGEEETLAPDSAGPLAVQVFKTLADPYVGKLSYLSLIHI